jgi:hypothetical protein
LNSKSSFDIAFADVMRGNDDDDEDNDFDAPPLSAANSA